MWCPWRTRQTDRAKEAAAGIHGVSVHAEPAAALDAPGVRAVLIASPGPAHEEALLAAFERGLPVLCEKPMTPDPAGPCEWWRRRPGSGGGSTGGVHAPVRREYLRLKSLLDSGRLGRPLMLHCTHRNVSSPPHFTTPMLINSSVSHEIDAAAGCWRRS